MSINPLSLDISSVDYEKLRVMLARIREVADNPPPDVPLEVLKKARERLGFMEAIMVLYSGK